MTPDLEQAIRAEIERLRVRNKAHQKRGPLGVAYAQAEAAVDALTWVLSLPAREYERRLQGVSIFFAALRAAVTPPDPRVEAFRQVFADTIRQQERRR